MNSAEQAAQARWGKVQADSQSSQSRTGADSALAGNGGDGTSGGMEARMARLESDMEHVKSGVSKLDADASELRKGVSAIQIDVAKGVGEIRTAFAGFDERSKHFTTRWDVVLMLGAVVALLSAVIALAVRFIPPAQ